MRLEPIRGCPQQILSLPRLSFRHAGVYSHFIEVHTPMTEIYDSTLFVIFQVFLQFFYPIFLPKNIFELDFIVWGCANMNIY